MKKLIVVLVVASALTTVLLWVIVSRSCSCDKDKSNVTVNIQGIAITEISVAKTTVDVSIEVKNDNAVGATLDKIEYDIYLGHKGKWIWLGSGKKDSLNIEANKVADFAVTTKIENSQLLHIMMDSILGTEPTEMKVDGHAWFKVGSATFKIHFEGKDIRQYNTAQSGK